MSRFITIDCNDRDSSFSIIRNSFFHIGQDKDGNIFIEDYNTYIKDIDELRLNTLVVSFSFPEIDLSRILLFIPKNYKLPDIYDRIRDYIEKVNYRSLEEVDNKYIEDIPRYCSFYNISLSLDEYCEAYNNKEINIDSVKLKVFR